MNTAAKAILLSVLYHSSIASEVFEECFKEGSTQNILLARQGLEAINPEGRKVYISSETNIVNDKKNWVFEARSTNLTNTKIEINEKGCLAIKELVKN